MVVVGRDARKSGAMVNALVVNTLRSLGINVTDLGMATTPTVELQSQGQVQTEEIIITASHNPAEWNALKLLNEKGEFLSAMMERKFLKLPHRRILILPAR